MGEYAIQWLKDKINGCTRVEAVELFCDFIRNGLLLCCTSNETDTLKHRRARAVMDEKEKSLYKFLWDVVDVDDIQIPLADLIPISYIVRASKYSMEEKAYQLYRKYVETVCKFHCILNGEVSRIEVTP